MCAPAARSPETVARRLALALLSWFTIAFTQSALGAVPLRVCLQAEDPPFAFNQDSEPRGFDVALADLISKQIDRPLEIQWFTTSDDPDHNPVTEADALLSDGHCALVADYPLLADKLGRPRAGIGKLPSFMGAKPEDRRRWIELGELIPTRAYRFDAITVVLAPTQAQRSVHTLADLQGLTLGEQFHSLPDLIAMSYRQGELAQHVVHFNQERELFSKVESGDVDAALVDQRALDAWHFSHPDTRVVSTSYQHSIGFNIGFVGLSSGGVLIQEVDKIVNDLFAEGRLAKLAQANGVTYRAPRKPDVAPALDLSAISGD
jgi:ABC-type amino acid transport substrate-binding protein